MSGVAAALAAGAAQGVAVSLAALPDSISALQIDPDDAYAGFALYSTGSIGVVEGSALSYANVGTWRLSGASSDYEARVTVNSGSLTSGTTGSWLALSASREWYLARTTSGTSTATITVEIRRVSDSVVVASKSVTLTSTVEL
jgi:autotransporter-associated beta strand protein